MAMNDPPVKSLRPPTGGVWFNVRDAGLWRRSFASPTSPESPMIYLLDLTGVQPLVGVIEASVNELAREMRAGRFGEAAIVVATQDPSVQRHVQLIAAAENLPIYLSGSTTAVSLMQAWPAAPLSKTDSETLDAIMDMGGSARASELAQALKLRSTAAINRLNGLVAKGLLHRQPQSGRKGDLYVDGRSAAILYGEAQIAAALETATSQ